MIKFSKTLNNYEEEIETLDLRANNSALEYPSVYSYYSTLPDYMQQQETVIDAARTIEKYGIYLDITERQKTLNFVASLNLPKDECKP